MYESTDKHGNRHALPTGVSPCLIRRAHCPGHRLYHSTALSAAGSTTAAGARFSGCSDAPDAATILTCVVTWRKYRQSATCSLTPCGRQLTWCVQSYLRCARTRAGNGALAPSPRRLVEASNASLGRYPTRTDRHPNRRGVVVAARVLHVPLEQLVGDHGTCTCCVACSSLQHVALAILHLATCCYHAINCGEPHAAAEPCACCALHRCAAALLCIGDLPEDKRRKYRGSPSGSGCTPLCSYRVDGVCSHGTNSVPVNQRCTAGR